MLKNTWNKRIIKLAAAICVFVCVRACVFVRVCRAAANILRMHEIRKRQIIVRKVAFTM